MYFGVLRGMAYVFFFQNIQNLMWISEMEWKIQKKFLIF